MPPHPKCNHIERPSGTELEELGQSKHLRPSEVGLKEYEAKMQQGSVFSHCSCNSYLRSRLTKARMILAALMQSEEDGRVTIADFSMRAVFS